MSSSDPKDRACASCAFFRMKKDGWPTCLRIDWSLHPDGRSSSEVRAWVRANEDSDGVIRSKHAKNCPGWDLSPTMSSNLQRLAKSYHTVQQTEKG